MTLRREIKTGIYRDTQFFGISTSDMPFLFGPALVIPFLLIPLGYIVLAIPLIPLWLVAGVAFLKWSKGNRKPMWFIHMIKAKIKGHKFHRIDRKHYKESIYIE